MRFTQKTIISLLALLTIVSFGLLLFSHKKADVDLWGNLGFVTTTPCDADYLRTNTYSFTEPDHEWINHEWLSEYILHTVYRLGANPLLLAFKTGLGFLLVGLLYYTLKRTCEHGVIIFGLLLLVMSTIGYGFSTRPHLFTYTMLVALLMVIRFKPSCLPVVAIPMAILWVNLHGAFFIGLIVLLAYVTVLGIQLRKDPSLKRELLFSLLAIVLFATASLINPYGGSIWTFIYGSAGKMRTYLSEWAPFNPITHFSDHTDFLALIILCGVATMKEKPKLTHWLLIGGMALVAAFSMRRNIPLFALVSVFAFAPAIDRQFGKHVQKLVEGMPQILKVGILVALTATSLLTFAYRNRQNPLEIEVDAERFPIGSVEFMKQHDLNGNLLVFFDWAEYCIWDLFPDTKVFIDGRYKSAYSTATIDAFFNFIYAEEGWERALTDFPTSMVLIHKDNPVYDRMTHIEGWTLACEDQISALFLRNSEFAEEIAGLAPLPKLIQTDPIVVFK
jgi:hypothetical protein